jgi:hypothetical protein
VARNLSGDGALGISSPQLETGAAGTAHFELGGVAFWNVQSMIEHQVSRAAMKLSNQQSSETVATPETVVSGEPSKVTKDTAYGITLFTGLITVMILWLCILGWSAVSLIHWLFFQNAIS